MVTVRNHVSFLCFLWMVAFVIRACVFFFYLSHDNKFWQVDSNTYHKVAVGIIHGKGIALPDGSPNFYRLPGYPLFLSLCYKIFGEKKHAALWIQVLLASCIPVLIFFVTLVLFPKKILLAKIVSLLSSFHLGLVLYAGFFMTESLFVLFFLIFTLFFFAAQRYSWRFGSDIELAKKQLPNFIFPVDDYLGEAFIRFNDQVYEPNIPVVAMHLEGDQRCRRLYSLLFFAGLSLGVASLVRPVGHYLIALVLVMFVIFSKNSFGERFRQCCVLFISWLIPVSFWLLRNYILLGHLFFNTLPGGHFLHLSAARVAMYVYETSYQKARVRLQHEVDLLIRKQERCLGKRLNDIERCYVHEQVAAKYFKMSPLIAMKNWMTDILRASLSLYSAEILYLESSRKEYDYFKKGRKLWSLFERYIFLETDNSFLKCLVYAEILLFLFLLIGVAGSFVYFVLEFLKKGIGLDVVFFIQSLLFVVFFLGIALAGGYARMRLPAEPFLLIYSLFFWIALTMSNKHKKAVK